MPKTSRAPSPNVGDFTRQVTWQRLNGSPQKNEYNQVLPDDRYTTVTDNLWVSIKPLSGREAVNAERMQATASHMIKCLYCGPIAASDRFKYLDPDSGKLRYFNVVNANNVDERSFQYEITCNELGNQRKAS